MERVPHQYYRSLDPQSGPHSKYREDVFWVEMKQALLDIMSKQCLKDHYTYLIKNATAIMMLIIQTPKCIELKDRFLLIPIFLSYYLYLIVYWIFPKIDKVYMYYIMEQIYGQCYRSWLPRECVLLEIFEKFWLSNKKKPYS